MAKNHNEKIKKLLTFLEGEQQPNGSFLSYSSPRDNKFSKASPYKTVFTTALILSALQQVDTPLAHKIKERAAKFLWGQKSKNFTWNYWDRSSAEYEEMPYPDDLDDTFCSLAALQTYDKRLISGDVLAKAVTILTALEEKEGGPYKTWIVDEAADEIWKDVDLGVNSNIAYFLTLNDVKLPNITTFCENFIKNEGLSSPYYPHDFALIYFLSRWYKGTYKKQLLDRAIKKLETSTNILEKACLYSAILRLNKKTTITPNFYNAKPKPYTFYTGINPKRSTKYFAGSAALTAAFMIEALSLDKAQQKPVKRQDETAIKIHRKVLKKVKKRCAKVSPEVEDIANKILQKLAATDKDVQIILLPYLYFTTLKKSRSGSGTFKTPPLDFFVQLGTANLYGWIAYTIYDDFLDEEAQPPTLPLANLCLRELTSIFESVLPAETGFSIIFHEFMDKIESANAWETTHCRFSDKDAPEKIPDFENLSQLADKSIGHALGPIAVLYSLGYKRNDIEVKKTISMFRSYIIARQLNDDAHDWKDDLNMGHINVVGAMVLERASDNLEKVFWDKIVINVSQQILRHAGKTITEAQENPAIHNHMFFRNLVEPLRQSAKKTLEEQRRAAEFIREY